MTDDPFIPDEKKQNEIWENWQTRTTMKQKFLEFCEQNRDQKISNEFQGRHFLTMKQIDEFAKKSKVELEKTSWISSDGAVQRVCDCHILSCLRDKPYVKHIENPQWDKDLKNKSTCPDFLKDKLEIIFHDPRNTIKNIDADCVTDDQERISDDVYIISLGYLDYKFAKTWPETQFHMWMVESEELIARDEFGYANAKSMAIFAALAMHVKKTKIHATASEFQNWTDDKLVELWNDWLRWRDAIREEQLEIFYSPRTSVAKRGLDVFICRLKKWMCSTFQIHT